MGLINTFNTLSNEHTEFKANGKLKDIFPELDFNHSIFLKQGNKVDKEYEVTEDDVIYCRLTPGEISTTAALIIGISVAVVAAGVAVGTAIYATKQAEEAKEQMEKAQRNAKNKAATSQTLPFIRGSKNISALGQNVQFVMGSIYNTSYNLTNGFYSIDGTDGVNSYYDAVLSCGFNEQKITEVQIGNEVIASDSNGITGQVPFNSSSLYYDSSNSNKVEVAQPGTSITLANCNQKVEATYSGEELKHEQDEASVPVTVQAADNAMKIQVCIQFASLREYDSEEETWKERTATVRPYWSNDGGANWNEFYFEGMSDNTISRNVNHTIRFVATKEFTAAESYGKNISIKVEKTTPKSDGSSQESCSLLWYQTFCYDANKSTSSNLVACTPIETELFNKTTRVAFRMIANSSTNNVLDELHCICEGKARIWNGVSWTSTKEPTRNPASWILEILESSIHTPSQYSDSEIDLDSLGALYEYCETNNFYTDGILTAETKKRDLISNILSTVNADMIINSDGKFEFVIDKEETTPVALLNAENIRSITYAKDFSRKTDGTKVTFTNRESWQVDTFYSMLDGGSYDYVNDTVEDLSLDYVTTYEHAYKMAQRKLRQRQLQPREIKVDVGLEGDYYPLYSTVLLQLKQLLQGLNSSVITNVAVSDGYITAIKIADSVLFDSSKHYGIVIQATNNYGNRLITTEVTGTDATRDLTLTTPIAVTDTGINPSIGNHLSFGLLDDNNQFSKVTNTMKIMGIEPNGDEGYTLTLKDYNTEIYSYGGTIPEYKSNLTRGQVPDNAVTIDDLNKVRQDMNTLEDRLRDAWKVLEFPVVVSADLTSAIVEIDEDGYCAGTQTFKTTISVKQGNESRDFVIGDVSLPDGWSMSVNQGRITFTVGEGAKVDSGQFKIPVIYQPVIAYYDYVDADGNNYVDESDEMYMQAETSASTYTYDVWFTYFGLGNGVYLGMFTSLDEIPSMPNLNDYFTWGGANDTASALSIDGVFKQARVYKYIGKNKSWEWEQDTNAGHGQAALSDVLGIANADLKNNNSTAWEYLDHLTANSIYVDMIVANSAFIDKLAAKVITTDLVTTNQLDTAIAEAEVETGKTVYSKLGVSTLDDYTIIKDGFIRTGLINASAIAIGDLANASTFQSDTLKKLGFTDADDFTIISGGYIKTTVLDVNTIRAGLVTTDSLTTGDLTVTGTINATAGTFSGKEVINGVFYHSGGLSVGGSGAMDTVSEEAMNGALRYYASKDAFMELNAGRAASLNNYLSLVQSDDLCYERIDGKVTVLYATGSTATFDLLYLVHLYENGKIAADTATLFVCDGMQMYKIFIDAYSFEIATYSPNPSSGSYMVNGVVGEWSQLSNMTVRINK